MGRTRKNTKENIGDLACLLSESETCVFTNIVISSDSSSLFWNLKDDSFNDEEKNDKKLANSVRIKI